MKCKAIKYSRHAFERMFERAIDPEAVALIIENGEVIAEYPEDRPYPSVLVLGFSQNQPIHLVMALDDEKNECHVITVYVPDAELWNEMFKQRRKP